MNARVGSRWLTLAAMFFLVGSGQALALGKSPTHAPTGELPVQHSVVGFEVPTNSQAFRNYAKWDHSHLPDFMQLFHCAGMALFARQVFNFASFDPSVPKISSKEYRRLLARIFKIPTPTLPGARPKIVIPGYATWNEMTGEPDIEEIVKDLLGDAFNDIFRPNWNWNPIDVFGSTHRSRSLIELNVRETISRDRPAIIYLTDGFKTAHAVLAYAYEVLGDRVRYTLYDSNHPTTPYFMDFLFASARFDHPDQGMRDPWILHPYADEFRSTRAFIRSMNGM